MKRLVVLLATVALLAAPAAQADGDPASDILLRDNVFFALAAPQTNPKGRELEALAAAATKHGFVLKVAVVQKPTDLGAVPQLYGRAQKYAKFLRTELGWLGFKGTLIVVMNGMPGGVGVTGPGAKAAEARTGKLSVPPNATLDQLADVAIQAVHEVAAANHVSLALPPQGNQTRDRLIIGAALILFIALVLVASRRLRRNRG